jgi:hypothetical protein
MQCLDVMGDQVGREMQRAGDLTGRGISHGKHVNDAQAGGIAERRVPAGPNLYPTTVSNH